MNTNYLRKVHLPHYYRPGGDSSTMYWFMKQHMRVNAFDINDWWVCGKLCPAKKYV